MENEGEHVSSWFVNEAWPKYGEEGDESETFNVDVTVPGMPPTGILFHSFEQMEEFSKHLTRYVEECRKRRK